jgi:hypothetical protein
MATIEDIKSLSVPFAEKDIQTVNKRGVNLSYISHSEITKRLNEVDPNWTIEPVVSADGKVLYEKCPESGTPTGAWFKLTICGVTKTVFGSYDPPVNKQTKDGLQNGSVKWSPLMDPDAPKKILSDAVSTGAMRWGVGLQLWSKTTTAKSVEDERAERVRDLSSTFKGASEDVQATAKAFLNGRPAKDLSDDDLDKLEEILTNG